MLFEIKPNVLQMLQRFIEYTRILISPIELQNGAINCVMYGYLLHRKPKTRGTMIEIFSMFGLLFTFFK